MVGRRLRSRFFKSWARLGLVLTVVLTLGTVSTLPAGASPTRAAGGADVGFYKGKTVTLIAPASTGDFIDLFSRLIGKYVGKYLHATVNIEDVPGSGQIIGLNRGYAAKNDGLTITDLNTGAVVSDIIEGYPGMHFDLNKWVIIGDIDTITENVIVAHPKSGITFDSLMKKGAKPYKVLDVRSGTIDATERLIFGAFGIPHQFVTAFSHQGTLFQAFEAGQGDLAMNTWSGLAGQAVRAGKAKSILSINVGTKQRFPGVPDYTTEMAKYKNQISKQGLEVLKLIPAWTNLGSGVLAAPPGTPPARVAALTQAMQWSAKQPAFQKEANKELIEGAKFESASQLRSAIRQAMGNKTLAKYLGKYSAS